MSAASESRPLRNLGYLATGQVIAGICTFARLTLLARYLGPLQYGYWGYATALASLFAPLADLGVSTIAVRDIARGRSATSFFGSAFVMKAFATTLLLFAIPLAGLATSPKGVPLLLVILIGAQMLAATFALLVQALFRAHERMPADASINAGVAVVSLVTTGLLAWNDAGLTQMAAGYFACTLLGLTAALVLARPFLPPPPSWDFRGARAIVRDCWPLGLGMMATAVYYFYDRILMGALGQGVQIGWYTVAYTPTLWLASIVGMVRVAFLPAQSKAFAGRGDVSRLLVDYGRLSFWIAAPVAIGGAFLGKSLLLVVYGTQYEGAIFAMQVLLATAGVMFVSSYFGSNLLAADRQRAYLKGVIVGALINIGLNSILVPLWSLNGAAVATLASEAAVCVIMAFLCRPWLGIAELESMIRKPALAATAMCIAILATAAFVPAIVSGVFAGVAYVAVSFKLGIVRQARVSSQPPLLRVA